VVRSADGSEITGARLLDSANTLYLISDSRRSKLLRPILIALLSELLDHAYETANNSPGRRLPAPLLVCLDELGNAVPLPNLAEIASTAASHNIQLISIFHDIAQARERYGQQALTAINNHRPPCNAGRRRATRRRGAASLADGGTASLSRSGGAALRSASLRASVMRPV
jgi:hypothetical protein